LPDLDDSLPYAPSSSCWTLELAGLSSIWSRTKHQSPRKSHSLLSQQWRIQERFAGFSGGSRAVRWVWTNLPGASRHCIIPPTIKRKVDKYCFTAALHSRMRTYIFILWLLLSIFFFISSLNVSRRTLDVYHISTHGVALVQI